MDFANTGMKKRVKKSVKKESKKIDYSLSMKKRFFVVLLAIIFLVAVCYGFSLGFETISSFRFILGGLFVLLLAFALFKDKVNTRPMGIALLIYLVLDVLLVLFGSKVFDINLIVEVVIILLVIYFVFLKKNKK